MNTGKDNGWRKGGALLAAVLLICMAVNGCSKTAADEVPEQPAAETQVEIGLSFDSFVIERWIRDRDIFVSAAKDLGAEVNVQNANGDVQEQIEQIEYFIKKQMDVIVVVAGDCEALTQVLRKAKDAGIKTICYDRLIEGADCDLYISYNSREVGRLMARGLADNLPEGGDIFMIQGPVTDQNVSEIKKGFLEVLEDTNLQVVYEKNCDLWLAEYAFTYVKDGLSLYPDVKGVMCGNDDLATQAFRALSEARLAGRVGLVGQDGDLTACQRIVEKTQQMTAFKNVEEEARLAAGYAVKLGKGEVFSDVTDTVHDGTYHVPYVELMPVAVTKENMDEVIIQNGYHAREDVYMNQKQQ